MNNPINAEKQNILKRLETILLCAVWFMLVFYHISNGETDLTKEAFGSFYLLIPFVLIVLAIISAASESGGYISIEDFILKICPVAVYISIRLGSGAVNELMDTPAFWASICYESLLLIGISAVAVNTNAVRICLCALVAFDLIAVSISTFHYFFIKDAMYAAVAAQAAQNQEYLPFTYIFVNPNPAGMLSGITASICMLTFDRSSKQLKYVLVPVILVNIVFLVWSNCLSATVGTGIILALCIAIKVLKSVNYRMIIAATMVICIVLLIPVYALSLMHNSEGAYKEDQLENTEFENVLNHASTGRYNLWKEHILSQKGHYMLGFGTPGNAVKERVNYIKDLAESDEDSENAELSLGMGLNPALGSHNGYIEMILVAGLPAALIIFAIMFIKICSLDNGFIDRHPVIMLSVMLLWLSVVETRFITSNVRYIAFLLMLLLSWREEGKSAVRDE